MFTAYRRYADFTGRSNRAEYWLFVLSVLLFTLLVDFAAGIVGALAGDSSGVIFLSGLGLWLLAILVPSLAVHARRLHDVDMSAWWMFIGVVPGVGALGLLIVHLLPGTPGPNRFGPPPSPKAPALAPAA